MTFLFSDKPIDIMIAKVRESTDYSFNEIMDQLTFGQLFDEYSKIYSHDSIIVHDKVNKMFHKNYSKLMKDAYKELKRIEPKYFPQGYKSSFSRMSLELEKDLFLEKIKIMDRNIKELEEMYIKTFKKYYL